MSLKTILPFTLRAEGGDRVSDHPSDPGGITKFGISDARDGRKDRMADLNGDGIGDKPVVDLTIEDAETIYRREYYDSRGCGDLPEILGDALFDHSVTSGSAAKLFQAVLNVHGADLVLDGDVGPKTKAACHAVADRIGPEVLARDMALARAGFYVGLWARRPKDEAFIKGWLNRVRNLMLYLGL
ncbi:glycoside hydrolase family 108 protein [Desulfovibrio inopinatus]|uniref:glycoside hydrolase family 108 protein n=1 Tax=Desulfovibrio inopinatus TaxID=102109 RepID=UPI00041CD00F|nr:glycosyl hydrolase 108 family protein [Desulfovibrio inopinatus]